MKRVVSMVLAVAILVGMLPATAWATEMETVGGTCGENLSWTFDESSGSLKISGTGDMDDYSWSQMYDPTSESSDIWVTDAPWRDYYNSIKSIDIESDVTSVGDGAFRGCSAVTSISLSNDVEALGEYSFVDCDGIIDIVIPENVKTIGEAAFSDCNALESVSTLGAASIGNFAFSECANLISVELPETLTSIGEYAFRGCEALRTVTIPSSVRTIGTFAFVWCESLNEICFEGSAPSMDGTILSGLTCNVSYPSDDETWSEELQKEFDDTITWNGNSSVGGASGSSHSHNFGDWYETVAPTQETEGEERRNCTGCNHYETRVKEKIPHSHTYISQITAPTCENQGYTTYTCECRDSYVDDYVDATGHNYNNGIVTMNPGCETEGVKTFTCSYDKNHTYTETVPATGHSYGDWYETKVPTQAEEGEERRDCMSCVHFESRTKNNLLGDDAIRGLCGDNLTWVLSDNGVLTISGEGAMTNWNYSSYSSIPWYDNRASISSVVIENGVTSIGSYAFYYCSNLSSVAIPDSIITIGNSAFYSCSSLSSVTIPNSVTSIGERVFYGCYNLTDVEIPGSIAYLSYYAFFGCSRLTSVTIPSGVKSISTGAFYHCTGLTNVTIPNTVTSINFEAFRGCTNLTNITIPESVTSIGMFAFEGCSALTRIDVNASNSYYSSDEYGVLFNRNKTILITAPEAINGQYIIPSTVESIGEYAFNQCNSLIGVTIPDSVTSIENYAFWYCTSLTSLIIPDSVTHIGYTAFANCTGLNSVTIPDSITSIENSMFDGCTSLTTVTIPNGIISIGSYAFRDCSLTNLIIPDSVTSIGNYTFMGCSSLSSIIIPDSVISIGEYAFWYCSNLTSMTIPDSITSIGIGTFSDCSSLTSITIPDSITSIGRSAFSNCRSLMNVTIPDSIITIENYVFSNCAGLTSVTLPNSVTNIGERAFYKCTGLTSIIMGNKVASIGTNAFSDCSSLIDVYYSGSEQEWALIDIGPHNTCLIDAKLYCNSIGPNAGDNESDDNDDSEYGENQFNDESIYYFSSWSKENKLVYLNIFDLYGSEITENTQLLGAENFDDLVGTYVLAKTRKYDDESKKETILVSMSALENRIGYVTSVDESSVTIDGDEYDVPVQLTVPDSYEDRAVLYCIRDGKLGAISLLNVEQKNLLRWNADTREVTFGFNAATGYTQTYTLSKLADNETLDFLNQTGNKSRPAVYWTSYSTVYKIREYTPIPPYQGEEGTGSSRPDTDEDKAISILIDYRDDWEEVYNAFIEAVNSTLLSFAGSDEEKRDAIIKKEANRMRNHDKTSGSKYVTGNLRGYEEQAYEALARFFYDYATCEIPNLSSVDTSGTMAGVTIINRIMKNMTGESKDYEFGHVTVSITAMIAFTSKFGTMTITDTKNKTSFQLPVCSTQQECEDTLNAYMDELRDLATNSIYNVATAVYKDILGKSLSSLTSEYMTKTVTNLERKLGVVLSEKFQKAGVGQNLINTIDECYTFYTWVNKGINTGKNIDIEAAVNNIINLKFEDTTVPKGITKEAMKALKKAANKMNRAFNEYLEGTILQKEQSFFRYLFNCPVEVSVYNSAGEQIGFVGEEDIWYTDAIVINEIGGAKEILSLRDDKLSFVVTATDYGTMSCCFEEFDDNFVPIGRLNYYDILLEPEKTFEITVPDNLAGQVETLAITSGSEKTYADEYIPVTSNGYITVNCNPTTEDGTIGGLVRGSGAHVRGEAVVLYAEAYEDFEFIGWFEGEHLVCVNELYEFTAKEDRNLTTKFFKNDFVYVDLDSAVGGTVIGEGRYHAGETATIIAAPHDGYTFGGWYAGNELVSSSTEYSFEITTDVAFVAKFEEQTEHIHKYTAVITAPSCTEKGYTTHTCSCGDSYMDSYKDATGHTVSKYSSDKESHWQVCTVCQEKMNEKTHSGGTATCTKKAVCAVCGTSYGELASHDYEKNWSQGDANGHWHECKNCSAHDTQVKHTPGAAATETTAQFCTVCDYVITPALGHTCTAGSKWYSNGTYHWHVCTSCGAWVKTGYHSYSSDTDETCNVCGYTRTATVTEPTEETEVAMTETTVPDKEVIATETAPTIVSTETNENLSDNAVSEDTDSHGISGVLITVFAIIALGSLVVLAILLVYKKRREST